MNITCQEEMLESTPTLANLKNPQNSISPTKIMSFNLPLKIKTQPKMAVIDEKPSHAKI
jgi:hypothetical protein